jgi:hypothetical protein
MEQCPYCKKYLLATQVIEHKCDTSLRTVKEIPVVFFYETLTQKGTSLVVAMGFDGVLYRLVKCKYPLTDEKKQPFRTDEDVPEPFIARLNSLLKARVRKLAQIVGKVASGTNARHQTDPREPGIRENQFAEERRP